MLLTSGFVNLTGTVIRLVSGRSSDRSRQAALSIIPAQPGNVAHTSGRPDKRQSAIQSAMLLMNWLLVPAAAVAVWLSASTHTTPMGGFVGGMTRDYTSALPTWESAYAELFPTCHAPVDGELAPRVLVVRQNGRVQIVSLERLLSGTVPMWKVGHCS